MSLLTIAQDAADEVGFDQPSTIIGNTNDDARRILRMCNREGKTLSQESPAFEVMHKEGSVTLATADQDYALPSDFRYMIPDTTWNRSGARRVINPISPSEWQFYKAWNTVAGINLRARIRNNELEFEQTISASENGIVVYFEYVADTWCMSSGDSAADQTAFVADTDIIVFDEELFTQGVVWRLRESLGLDWQLSYKLYEKLKRQQLARTGGARTVDLGGDDIHYLGVNTPDDNFG